MAGGEQDSEISCGWEAGREVLAGAWSEGERGKGLGRVVEEEGGEGGTLERDACCAQEVSVGC